MGARVEMHREHFKEDADDTEWLPTIAARKWVILSKDQYNYLERLAIKNAGGRAFLLVPGGLKGVEQAAIISKELPEMLRILDLTKPPFIGNTEMQSKERKRLSTKSHETTRNNKHFCVVSCDFVDRITSFLIATW
ncbi:MAG TPA: hypothetical protein VF791_24030, partial [Pyrinomonadaceae bacterium]